MMWKCHVDEFSKGRYDMILGRDLLIGLVLNLKLYEYLITANYGTLKGSTSPMVDFGVYINI